MLDDWFVLLYVICLCVDITLCKHIHYTINYTLPPPLTQEIIPMHTRLTTLP
ncbi:hypothetical protein BO71DRAFT_252911 [Aspergillus ellipticus CBS 707.79]|uniref:Uncharacterized protein n=1 Tax=Aspergillus ellipticus CBS 707.79 TaxID=1448320 RepID=A0A319D8M5_9EURO|nr:hypothetical protein BO71DRAFT_252911 [Aspergillus ellipticus CBS 707.79]